MNVEISVPLNVILAKWRVSPTLGSAGCLHLRLLNIINHSTTLPLLPLRAQMQVTLTNERPG